MTIDPQIAAAIERRLRPSPRSNPGLVCTPFGDKNTEIKIFLYADMLDELRYAAAYDERASAAVLTGGFGLEPPSGFIESTGFEGFEYGPLDAAYDGIREVCDSYFTASHVADDVVVGLFVAENGCDAKPTAAMVRLHLSLFNVPFQPLVVLDPDTEQVGVYVRPPKHRFINSPFWLVRSSGA